MNVALTPELEEMVQQGVQSGLYASPSDVVQAGLRLLAQENQKSFEALKADIAMGVEQADRGELLSAEDVFARLYERNDKALARR